MKTILAFVHYNSEQFLFEAISSLKQSFLEKTQIVVLDNSASQNVKSVAEKNSLIYRAFPENLGYGKAFNEFFLKESPKAEFFGFLNSDLLFPDDNWLRKLIDYLETHPEVGAIGPKLINKDGTLHSCGMEGPAKIRGFNQPDKGQFDLIERVPCLTGACFLMPAKLFRQLNGFDERFFLFYEETDLFFRLRKIGFEVVFFGKTSVVHRFSEHRWTPGKSKFLEESRRIFLEKWKELQ